MRVAIMGVGSLGTILGAYISKAGRQIDLIDVNKEHVDALNKRGATVIGKVLFNVPVKALTPDQMTGTYDLVFYMTKQTYNETALAQLKPHLGPNSTVCTLQNGLPEPAVAEIVGKERTIGCTVGWGATWIGAGVSELTSDPAHMVFDVGSLDGKITDGVKLAQEYLQLMCPTHILTNLIGVRWSKLLVNSTFSGMSTVLGCTFGEVMDDPRSLRVVEYIANEVIHVAHADGVKLELFSGNNLDLLAFENEKERDATVKYYPDFFGPHRLLKASMLQDLEKGRKCEIDAINGVVCTFGRKVGVPTPANDKVVEIVKGIEAGKNKYTFSNIEMFKSVLPMD
ncbi:ketopantoate reductase family protein [Papillibacter cinnamivorans]|uniref:2-dehydropantoate 2-reductase n=1 Tax=Papillibacter cinnamivorans DSM 12816 TaxID=1122930 RepID=A0A1W1Z1M1_9FIRM|nr:2-dehydropantoate 2-reductase [Papillibacter cinnamivorans]SMC42283.1 2-dehydropantoate 2-reductase [Papillibacter cinnamivorans DSM 12816]